MCFEQSPAALSLCNRNRNVNKAGGRGQYLRNNIKYSEHGCFDQKFYMSLCFKLYKKAEGMSRFWNPNGLTNLSDFDSLV